MGLPLDRISISGFKSIRHLQDFPLNKLNIIVGANGAGKSNFVGFFKMLRAIAEEGLANFVTENGGADGFFFGGPKESPQIDVHLKFGMNEYQLNLVPTASIKLMVKKESVFNSTGDRWISNSGGGYESQLRQWKNTKSAQEQKTHPGYYVYKSVSNWHLYHFHETGMTAPVRRDHSVRDWRELNPDASNIAAFLLHLSRDQRDTYEKIRETVQLIAPFFDDFFLESEKRGVDEVVRLEWRQKGSSYPFQPWHLSDGTIRFICLATVLLQPHPPATLIIDEPELGMHPFALDVLAGLFRDAVERTQLIVSTQSAALLNHFEPNEIIVVDRESGASRFRHLDNKSLAEWLKDFSLGELWQKNVFAGGPSRE